MKKWVKITNKKLPPINKRCVLLNPYDIKYIVTLCTKDTIRRGYTDNNWIYYFVLPDTPNI